jgi:hypothetical protein
MVLIDGIGGVDDDGALGVVVVVMLNKSIQNNY